VVPAGTQLLFLSGQVGIRPDGSLPDSTEAQAEQIFANIAALSASQGLAVSALVKISIDVVAGKDMQAVSGCEVQVHGHPSARLRPQSSFRSAWTPPGRWRSR
jgi:enamine deaminase RidA (YjgF/YER057c/UK114 family)